MAWLLTGLAFFLVLVLALALCTRMRPENTSDVQNADYLASVGYLSHPREGSRELGKCLFVFVCLCVIVVCQEQGQSYPLMTLPGRFI